MGKKRTQEEQAVAGDFKSWREAMPREGLVIVNGHRRKGKTRTVWGIAEQLHRRGRSVTAFRFPEKLRHVLPTWVHHADSLEALKSIEGHVIVADEMVNEAYARQHMTPGNIEWAKTLAVVAQFHHLVLAIYQHSRQMDLSLAMDGDLMLFKQPSVLHVRFARPELRPELKEAIKLFQSVSGDPRHWMYLVDWHNGKSGFLKSPSPSFWSEELSTAYALAQLEELEEEMSAS